jgi:hypothetical protein
MMIKPERSMTMTLTKKQQAAVWDRVWHWPSDMKGVLAARAAQRVMEEHSTDIVEVTLDRDGSIGEEPGRILYLLAVRGDGRIGALSRAADAIGRAFGGATRSLAGDGSTPMRDVSFPNGSGQDFERVGAAFCHLKDVAGAVAMRIDSRSSFVLKVLRMFDSASAIERERLRVAFPEIAAAWEGWLRTWRK